MSNIKNTIITSIMIILTFAVVAAWFMTFVIGLVSVIEHTMMGIGLMSVCMITGVSTIAKMNLYY